MMYQPVDVPQFFMFWADPLPEVMPVNHLAWREKAYALDVSTDLPHFLTEKTTVWFLGYRNKPAFCLLNF